MSRLERTLERFPALVPCLLGLAAVAAHWHAIHFGRVYAEDYVRMFGASAGEGWSSWTQLFSPRYFEVFPQAFFYRPLTTAYYHAGWVLFGTDIQAYQWVKALVVCGSSVFVFLLGLRLLGSRVWALAGALLYAASPVCAFVMTGLSFVDDVFAAFFLLAALWAGTRVAGAGRMRPLLSAGMALSYLLALLCKETAVVFPVLLVLYDRALPRGSGAEASARRQGAPDRAAPESQRIPRGAPARPPSGVEAAPETDVPREGLGTRMKSAYLPVLAVTALYLAGLLLISGRTYATMGLHLEDPLWKPAARLLMYFSKLFAPIPDDPPGALSVSVATLALAGMLAWEWRAGSGRRAALYGFWIVVGLLPVLNIVSSGMMPGYMAGRVTPDRHLILAGVPFFWLVAATLRRGTSFKRGRVPVLIAAAAALLLSVGKCRSYESLTRDSFMTPLRSGEFLRPGSTGVGSRFGSLMVSLPFIRRREPDEYADIVREVRRALPGHDGPTVVDIFSSDGIFEDPRGYATVIRALSVKGFEGFHRELAEASQGRGSGEAASAFVDRLQASVRLNDEGVRMFRAGDREGALAKFREALVNDPHNVSALLSLGAALSEAGETAEALRMYDRVAAIQGGTSELRAHASEAGDRLREELRRAQEPPG